MHKNEKIFAYTMITCLLVLEICVPSSGWGKEYFESGSLSAVLKKTIGNPQFS